MTRLLAVNGCADPFVADGMAWKAIKSKTSAGSGKPRILKMLDDDGVRHQAMKPIYHVTTVATERSNGMPKQAVHREVPTVVLTSATVKPVPTMAAQHSGSQMRNRPRDRHQNSLNAQWRAMKSSHRRQQVFTSNCWFIQLSASFLPENVEALLRC